MTYTPPPHRPIKKFKPLGRYLLYVNSARARARGARTMKRKRSFFPKETDLRAAGQFITARVYSTARDVYASAVFFPSLFLCAPACVCVCVWEDEESNRDDDGCWFFAYSAAVPTDKMR